MSRPTLRLYDGMKHTSPHLKDSVKELQTILKQLGYRVVPDGEFGPYTESVVKLFQASKRITPDGVVGPQTWALFLNQAAPSNIETAFQTSYSKWDKTLLKQLEEVKKYESVIQKVAAQYDILPSVIAGIGSRESHWGLALTPPTPAGTGDGGHGRGLMQIDDRWHIPFIQSGKWANAADNIIYGCAVLKSSIDLFTKNKITGFLGLQGGIAGYNAGPSRALAGYNEGYGVDYYTTGRNYSKDVLERAGWFQLQGWK